MPHVPVENTVNRTAYEAPVVVAAFPKQELEQDLPEDLAPHIHAVQNS